MDVTVAISTFGDESWWELAKERALPSAQAAGVPYVIMHTHNGGLDVARNTTLSMVETEWVCFLDADDELEPGYFEAMERATADLRGPAVRYVTPHRQYWEALPRVSGHDHRCKAECLTAGNWLVVGTLVRAEMVRKVGGWRDFTWSEDWDLWLRCYLAGATVEAVPKAVYRAWYRPDSRNRAPQRAERLAAHNAIAKANGLAEVPA